MLTDERMLRKPRTGISHTSIRRALGVVRRGHARHVPIVQDGRRPGGRSDGDLQGAVVEQPDVPPGAGVLRAPAPTVTPDAPVEGSARPLRDTELGRLPIGASSPTGPPTSGRGDPGGAPRTVRPPDPRVDSSARSRS
jgi:CBS domain-containing protein